jgi:hypothetical protein
MNWDKVKSLVGKSAPLLGTLVGGPMGTAVTILASAFGTEATPDALEKAIVTDPDAVLRLRSLEDNNRTLLSQAAITSELTMFEQTHQTIRAELAIEDKFKSYWRPAFGYAMVLSWLMVWGGIMYSIFDNAANAKLVINALADTTVLWGVALSVLGVQISKRSQDKQVAAGAPQTTLLSRFKSILGKG